MRALALHVVALGGRLHWLLSAAATLLSGCAKPPPGVALSPVGPSTPVIAAVVAAQATLLQARYGCTMGGCGPGYACDKKTQRCKSLEEGASARATSEQERTKEACVASADGLVTLCLQTPVGASSFRLRAQNAGPSVVALSLRELYVSRVPPCTSASDEKPTTGGATPATLPVAKPLGLWLAAATNDPASEPRSTLFLAPGPDVDLDVGFEIDRRSACALEISAVFEVTHSTLTLSIDVPPLGAPP